MVGEGDGGLFGLVWFGWGFIIGLSRRGCISVDFGIRGWMFCQGFCRNILQLNTDCYNVAIHGWNRSIKILLVVNLSVYKIRGP